MPSRTCTPSSSTTVKPSNQTAPATTAATEQEIAQTDSGPCEPVGKQPSVPPSPVPAEAEWNEVSSKKPQRHGGKQTPTANPQQMWKKFRISSPLHPPTPAQVYGKLKQAGCAYFHVDAFAEDGVIVHTHDNFGKSTIVSLLTPAEGTKMEESTPEGLWIPFFPIPTSTNTTPVLLPRITLRLDGLPPWTTIEEITTAIPSAMSMRNKETMFLVDMPPSSYPDIPTLIDKPLVVGRSIIHPSIHVAQPGVFCRCGKPNHAHCHSPPCTSRIVCPNCGGRHHFRSKECAFGGALQTAALHHKTNKVYACLGLPIPYPNIVRPTPPSGTHPPILSRTQQSPTNDALPAPVRKGVSYSKAAAPPTKDMEVDAPTTTHHAPAPHTQVETAMAKYLGPILEKLDMVLGLYVNLAAEVKELKDARTTAPSSHAPGPIQDSNVLSASAQDYNPLKPETTPSPVPAASASTPIQVTPLKQRQPLTPGPDEVREPSPASVSNGSEAPAWESDASPIRSQSPTQSAPPTPFGPKTLASQFVTPVTARHTSAVAQGSGKRSKQTFNSTPEHPAAELAAKPTTSRDHEEMSLAVRQVLLRALQNNPLPCACGVPYHPMELIWADHTKVCPQKALLTCPCGQMNRTGTNCDRFNAHLLKDISDDDL